MANSHRTNRTLARRLAGALAWGAASGTLAIAMATPAHAQQVNASLRGNISTDSQVTQVTAVDVNTGLRRTVSISPNGNYVFASLRPGTYLLELTTADGIQTTEEFTLLVAQDARLDFDLTETDGTSTTTAGAVNEDNVIVVTADRLRSMEGGEVGLNITQREIDTLPQNNRNFLAFADLAPGVAFVTESNGSSRLQGGAQDSRTTNIFIDGVGQKDYVLKNGITGQDSSVGNPFPQSAIGEYRVLSSNYKAEFDQVSSVAITAVTRSGTNEFQGDFFFEYSDENFRAKRPNEQFSGSPQLPVEIDEPKTPQQDMQFGASLGGPIIEDTLFFFGSYEGKRIDEPLDIEPGSANNQENIPDEYLGEFGGFSAKFVEDLYFGKLDFTPNSTDLFQASLKYRRETGDGINSGSNLRSTTIDQNVTEYRGLLRWEHTADNWVNDLKLTYEDVSWAPTPRTFENAFRLEDGDGAFLFQTGGGSNYQDKGQTGWGLQNDFTWVGFDRHTIKAGVKMKTVELKTLQLNLFNPVYTYNTEYDGAAFNDEIPYQVQFGYDSGLGGDPIVNSKNFQLGIYIQDDWEVTDRLTLNLGLRWDYDRTPAYVNYVTPQDALDAISPENYPNLVNADYDINDFISTGSERSTFTGAFQPRIGFSYEIDSEHQFVLFGGFGRSYDRNQFDFIRQETSVGSYSTRTFRFQVPGDDLNDCDPSSTCVVWDPIYLTQEGRDQLVASVGPQGGAELRFFDNDLKVPYSDQYSLGLRRQFGLVNAEIGYTHIESRDGFALLLGNRLEDGSFFDEDADTQSPPYAYTPSGRGSIIIGTNGLETNSDSAYLKLVKRYSETSPWNITSTYTYTQAEENRAFGQTFSLNYPSIDDYPILRSSGVSRHRWVTAGSVDLPFDFLLSGKLTLASPPYLKGFYNGPNGELLIDGTVGNNKKPFIVGDIWGLRQLDLALTKFVPLPFLSDRSRVRLRVDVFNVLNEENYITYNANARDTNPDDTSGSFGDISSFATGGNPPRTFKFSVGFSF